MPDLEDSKSIALFEQALWKQPDLEGSKSIALFEQAASIELAHFDHVAQPLVLKKVIARSVI
jgi:hypothetical protein